MHPLFIVSTTTSFVAVALLLGVFIKHARAEEKGHPDWSAAEMHEFLIWGMFYANPNDSRNFPPKTSGLGWTINFRDRRSAYIFVALLVVNLAAAIGMSIAVVGAAPP